MIGMVFLVHIREQHLISKALRFIFDSACKGKMCEPLISACSKGAFQQRSHNAILYWKSSEILSQHLI